MAMPTLTPNHGKVVSARFATVNGKDTYVVTTDNGATHFFSTKYVANFLKGEQLEGVPAILALRKAHVEWQEFKAVQGQPVYDDKGKAVIDEATGKALLYTKTHERKTQTRLTMSDDFVDKLINIEFKARAKAKYSGANLVAMFAKPAAEVSTKMTPEELAKIEAEALEQDPIAQ